MEIFLYLNKGKNGQGHVENQIKFQHSGIDLWVRIKPYLPGDEQLDTAMFNLSSVLSGQHLISETIK